MTWPLVRRDRWRTTVRVLAVLALLAPLVLPLVLLVLGALDTPGQSPPQTARDLLPDQPGRAGLDAALAMTPLWRQLANTALVTAVAVPVTVLLASSAGFAIGAGRGRSARWLLWVTVLLALVPPQQFSAFGGVQATMEEEARSRAEVMVTSAAGRYFSESGRMPVISVELGEPERVVREYLATHPEISALVLGASRDGADPLVTHFSAHSGTLPCPLYIVPGDWVPETVEDQF